MTSFIHIVAFSVHIMILTVYLTTLSLFPSTAGKTTTNDELEDMLESGNLAVFTQDVSKLPAICPRRINIQSNFHHSTLWRLFLQVKTTKF